MSKTFFTPNAKPATNKKITPPSIGVTGVELPGFGGIGGANMILGIKRKTTNCTVLTTFSTNLFVIILRQFCLCVLGKYIGNTLSEKEKKEKKEVINTEFLVKSNSF